MKLFRKSVYVISLAVLSTVPVMHSAAFSAGVSSGGMRCEQLALMSAVEMSAQQLSLAARCDEMDSAREWERQYGNMDYEDAGQAVVYDPS